MENRLGHIQLPKELHDVTNTKSKNDSTDPKVHEKPERPSDFDEDLYNHQSYLVQFHRLIDPVIISAYFGLFKSKKLPPLDLEKIELDDEHEFGASIEDQRNQFMHYLFCLYLSKKGYPDEAEDLLDYRRELYGFIEKIIDHNYFVDVILPFYLQEANEDYSGTSFLYRLRESGFVKFKSDDSTPEYLAMEFAAAQDEFINETIKPLVEEYRKKDFYEIKKKQKKKEFDNSFSEDIESYIRRGESSTIEFKETFLFNMHTKNADKGLKEAAVKEICAFANNKGGKLIIGVEDENFEIVGLDRDFKLMKKGKDEFELQLNQEIQDKIGKVFASQLIEVTFEEIDEKTICVVNVLPSDEPVFFNKDEFYVRRGSSSIPLNKKDTVEYINRNLKHR